MRKQTPRVLLGVCYMCLLTTLLLYQAGVFGGRRVWTVAVLGTLFLGVSLAVVLALYLRVTDQIAKSKENPRTDQTERKPAAETYVLFLSVVENCTLSERELEVAWLLYRGYTNRQIGETLYIAETTVKKHVSHIYQKMDEGSRKEFRAKVKGKMAEPSCPAG